MFRTKTCGELTIANVGEVVTLAGWVQKSRKMGGMTFLDMRDRYGITQVVFNEEKDAALCEQANKLGREWVIQVEGTVAERSNKNKNISTGEIEIIANKLVVLSASEVPPFTIEDNSDGGDDLRMQYRYLDIRRNPVRQNLLDAKVTKAEATESFGLDPKKRTVLVIGGSLGARTVNESILQHIEDIRETKDVQFIWQTGKYYSQEIHMALAKEDPVENMKVTDFISNMDNAYAAADLVISRAGASSISELCLLKKPCILVPSPNVAEDHQTKNALALSTKGAAIFVKDSDARNELIPLALKTVVDDAQLASLSENVGKLAYHDSAKKIADEVVKLAVEQM